MSSQGPSTDQSNTPVVDPTENVREIIESERRRQDDLRHLDSKWRDKVDAMQINHAWEIRKAESDRIDAILEAAAVNVQRAADVQSGVAERLATQVTGQAEVVRQALRAEVEPLQKDIADLRRVQYEGVGQKEKGLDSRALLAATVGVAAIVLLFYNTTHHQTPTVNVCVPTAAAKCP